MTKELMAVLVPVLGEELAAALIEHRRVTIKKVLTPYAAKLLIKEYEKTGDPRAACEMQIVRSWQGFKASWYFKEIANDQKAIGGSFIDAARALSTDVSSDWPHAGGVQFLRKQ
jgi:hypothetical protein